MLEMRIVIMSFPDDIKKAAKLLEGKVIHTPLVYSPTFSKMTGAEVYLKLENLQKGGSFKIRGATYKIQTYQDRIGADGVIAASIGNHAQGVAIAARDAGVPATIIMPVWTSITKQEATREYGAQVILKGQTLVESIQIAQQMAVQSESMFIHPYDDLDLIIGQGTIGLEILEDLPDADTILVPVGGGGLISGIALAAKAIRPEIRIIGVQAEACPSAYVALREGKPISVEEKNSIADAIMVTQMGVANFPILKEKVDDIVLVSEEQLSSAILLLLERKKVLAEGAGATPLAALLGSSSIVRKGSKVVLVISGGNVDSPLLDRIIRQGLLKHGRIMRFSVILEDRPGSIAHLLDLIAKMQANIIHIYHARNERDLPIYAAKVELELETRGIDHIAKIANSLKDAGYNIDLK
jgi:threonine dehydratase